MNPIFRFTWLKYSYFSMLLLSMLAMTGCGGGSSTTDTQTVNSNENGTVLIAMTDAAGDFIRYSVEVLSIKMTHADGRVVETLPISSRIDFAEYVNLTEFITAATVPNGRYVKGSMVLDYTNADIWVEAATGEALPVNSIVDESGNTLTTIEVSVNLDGQNVLPVAPGIPKHLTLDFDLKTSNTVTLNADSASIVVAPKLIASVDLNKSKQHRLRGPLKSVDVTNNNFELFIRPFRHTLVKYKKHFGRLKIQSLDSTLYEIDGLAYQGTTGLSVMESLATLTGVIVRGSVKFNPLRFEAEQVFAGSSVPGGTLDVVQGSVVSRTADVIQVHGARVTRADGTVIFNDAISVQLAASTIVKRRASMSDFTIADISIGSRVLIFGSVINEAATNFEFDASNGYARIGFSNLTANVVSSNIAIDQTSSMVLNLRSINGRSTARYNFAGTGIDSNNDALVDSYEVDTASLNLANIVERSNVALRGFVATFGSAPQDFNAQTVVTLPENSVVITP
ncbi:hypothetical protein MNBD_GAMMA22-1591 [hydrothermal vent metagenome]|uniref:DUF4382 domain-containing protein n=1 Tax=hydrothermal vent metagenome TaxID=652676 RepID=A0A3B0ZYJ6_9ZZZZ